MTNPLSAQVGGTHYKGYDVQPVELWHANQLDPFIAAAVKYLTRWKQKGGVQDLEKAAHYITIREALLRRRPIPLTADEYAERNGMSDAERAALRALLDYGEGKGSASAARASIGDLIAAENQPLLL